MSDDLDLLPPDVRDAIRFLTRPDGTFNAPSEERRALGVVRAELLRLAREDAALHKMIIRLN